jgi:hypothetical protein
VLYATKDAEGESPPGCVSVPEGFDEGVPSGFWEAFEPVGSEEAAESGETGLGLDELSLQPAIKAENAIALAKLKKRDFIFPHIFSL